MQRFLMWTSALLFVFAVGVAAQAKMTLEEHAKIMKANAQAVGPMNKAIASATYADARTQVAALRTNFMTLQGMWASVKKDDAVAIVKDGLSRLDAIDKMLSAATVDQMAVQGAVKEFQGATCGACHKLYREGDGKTTPYSFKAGVL
jgi:predicted NAD/FAD-binding protein